MSVSIVMLYVSSFERITSPICFSVTLSKLRRLKLASVASADRSRAVALAAAVSTSTARFCADMSFSWLMTWTPPAVPYCAVALRGSLIASGASDASFGASARMPSSCACDARFADSRRTSACRSKRRSAAMRASLASRFTSPSRWSAVCRRSISADENAW